MVYNFYIMGAYALRAHRVFALRTPRDQSLIKCCLFQKRTVIPKKKKKKTSTILTTST